MCDAIRHRGPDDWGTFVEGGVGLGMRRLSIIDLAGGHQPMGNEDESVQVVLNGEIYNHEALRRELRGPRATSSAPGPTPRSWSTCTRTRASGCSQRLRGHVRLRHLGPAAATAVPRARPLRPEAAVLHRARRPAHLRLRDQGAARRAIPSLATLSPFALDQYLTLRFVQPPDTFFEGVRALPPAHFLVWENGAPPGSSGTGT